MLIHHFLKMSSQSLTNFAVNRNHVTTVVSQIEVLLSLHAISATLHNTWCASMSFHSEIWANRFHRMLVIAKLHHQESIHHWKSDRIFHLLLLLDKSSMGMCSLQLLCPGSFSPIQTSSHFSWHRDANFQVEMSLQMCHTLVPNLHATQQNSNQHSIPPNSRACL